MGVAESKRNEIAERLLKSWKNKNLKKNKMNYFVSEIVQNEMSVFESGSKPNLPIVGFQGWEPRKR